MTVKTFFFGLFASFGIPWLVLVAIPFSKMRSLEPVEYDEIADGTTGLYQPKLSGRAANGAVTYGKEGCATCHSQLSRPTYAGNDVFQDGLAGIAKDPERGNTRRESNIWDYSLEFAEGNQDSNFAWIGETRIGPDLGNYGRRVEFLANQRNEETAKALGIKVSELPASKRFDSQKYVLTHIFNPRLNPERFWSVCPSNPQMFTEKKIYGQGSVNAIPVEGEDAGYEIIPDEQAVELADYLLSLKRDGDVPFSMNYRRDKVKASEKK